MRIFYNPKDRKGLEENERKASVQALKVTEYERVESEPARSAGASKKAKTQGKTAPKEAGASEED